MFRAAEFGRRARVARARIDQVDRVELAATGVALVAASTGLVAVRAFALDVAVGEEALRFGVVEQVLGLGVQVVVFEQRVEQTVSDVAVVVGHGRGEGVEGDAHPVPGVEDGLVELGDYFGRRSAFVVGAHGDRRTVGVGTGDHGDAASANAVIASEDVGGQVGAAELSMVDRAVGIGPCHADENVVAHGWWLRVGFTLPGVRNRWMVSV